MNLAISCCGGPGGHGKSDMVLTALKSLGLRDDEIFIQSFGEGMSEDRLWGGPDMASLDTCLRYDTEKSFLSSQYKAVVFEEIFDAPAQSLLPLKDVLTRRVFMNGPDRVPLSAQSLSRRAKGKADSTAPHHAWNAVKNHQATATLSTSACDR